MGCWWGRAGQGFRVCPRSSQRAAGGQLASPHGEVIRGAMKLVKTGVRIEISKGTSWGKLWSYFWPASTPLQHPLTFPPYSRCFGLSIWPRGFSGSGNTPGYSDWWLVGRLTRNSRPPAQCCNADERWAAAPEGPPCCVSLPPFLCPQSPLLPHIGVWGWAGPAAAPAKRCSQPGMTWQWAPASGGAAAGSPMQSRLPWPSTASPYRFRGP